MSMYNYFIFLLSPLLLFDIRVEVIMPSFTALFSGFIMALLDHNFRYSFPINLFGIILLNQYSQITVLLLSPFLSFCKIWILIMMVLILILIGIDSYWIFIHFISNTVLSFSSSCDRSSDSLIPLQDDGRVMPSKS